MTTVLISPAHSNRDLTEKLENIGARCLAWPTLQFAPPTDDLRLREAIENLFGYDWLILKSAHAAEYFLAQFLQVNPAEALDTLRVLAVGQETVARVGEFQIHVDIALERFAGNNIYDAIRSYVGDDDCARLNLLVPSANIIREQFAEQFEEAGARVDSIAAYRTTANSDQLAKLKALLAGDGIDYVFFTNASAVYELGNLFDTDDLPRLLKGVPVVCADQSTIHAANEFGLAQTLTVPETVFSSSAKQTEHK